jgi:hypothetical protein
MAFILLHWKSAFQLLTLKCDPERVQELFDVTMSTLCQVFIVVKKLNTVGNPR